MKTQSGRHQLIFEGASGTQVEDFFMLFAYLSDGVVPRASEEFRTYLKLRKIYLPISSPIIPKHSIEELRSDIREFFELYDGLVRDKLAKVVPKVHNLAHYADFIEQMGPPMQYDTRKFERGHQSHKQKDKLSKQFKNKSYSIVKNYVIGANFSFKVDDFEIKKLLSSSDFRCPTLAVYQQFFDLNKPVYKLKSLTLNKISFQTDSLFRLLGIPLKFVRIVFLAREGDDNFVILGSCLNCVQFLEPLQCYQVEQDSSLIRVTVDMIDYRKCTMLEDNLILYDAFVY